MPFSFKLFRSLLVISPSNTTYMKRNLLLCFFIFSFFSISTLWAQEKGTGGKRNMPPDKMPKIGAISGKIMDIQNSEPVEYATIALIRKRSGELTAGTISKSNGSFQLSELPPGMYQLKVEFMGFESWVKDSIRITPQKREYFFNDIKLKPAASNISGVEITAEKQLFVNKIDRRVINVEQSIVSAGGSALDVLKTAPSIDVDLEGNISLRGSENIKVLIDGKPSGIAADNAGEIMEQLPSGSIENIELITNPSARFDPEGMAGIINVVLKKNKIRGISGSVMGGVGPNDQYNGSFNISKRNEHFNLYTSASFRQMNFDMEGINLRKTWYNDSIRYYDQESEAERNMKFAMFTLGGDYYISPTSTLSLSGRMNLRKRAMSESTLYKQYETEKKLFDTAYRGISENSRDGWNYSLDLNYEKTFSSRDHYLKAGANFSQGDNTRDGSWTEESLDDQFNTLAMGDQSKNTTGSKDYDWEFSLDYSLPFSENNRLELGARSNIRNMDDDYTVENLENSSWIYDSTQSNHFIYKEQVHALYSQYAHSLGSFSFQAGLRAEQVYTDSELKTTGEKYEDDYISLYPSAFILQKIGKTNEVKLNYSRRVHRPRGRQLNPFGNSTDPMNIRRGNPLLKPEYVNSYEFSWQKFLGRSGSFTATVYHRYTTDVIQRFTNVDSSGRSVTTYENLDTQSDWGGELSLSLKITPWWQFMGGFNIFYTDLAGTNESEELSNNGTNWNIKGTNSFKLPWDLSLQLSSRYYAPRIIAQGEASANFSMDFGLRKNLLDNKATISFNVRDVFQTRKWEATTSGEYFSSDFTRQPTTRFASLSFTWRFGSMKNGKDRKQMMRQDNSSGDMDDMDI